MAKEFYINCPTCDHPNQAQVSFQIIKFPHDIDPIMALLEGTLNSINCSLCNQKISLQTPIAILNLKERAGVIVAPEKFHSSFNDLTKKISGDWSTKYCQNYSELYLSIAPWINSLITPALEGFFSGAFFDKPQEEQISMLSPLVLRIFNSQLNGRLIEKIINFGQQTSDTEEEEFWDELHTSIITDLILKLYDKADKLREIPQLDSILRQKIPAVCITPEVLSIITKRCIDLKDPREDPANFGRGFLREYLNAILYSYSNTTNPRGKHWAGYLIHTWLLSREEGVIIDSQYAISTETIRQITDFHDLWNITLGSYKSNQNSGDFEQLVKQTGEMMKHYGFEKEYLETLENNPIRIQAESKNEVSFGLLKETLINTILNRFSFNKSIDESIQLGNIAGGSVDWLITNGQKQAALNLANEMLLRALNTKDYIAAVVIGATTVEAMNKAEEFEFSMSVFQQLWPIIDDDTILSELQTTRPSLLLNLFNELGNVLRYSGQYDEALRTYQVANEINSLLPDEEQNPKNISTLRRNQAIVYREMGKFRQAKEILDHELKQNPDDHLVLHSLVVLASQTNNFEESIIYLDKAINITAEKMAFPEQARYLLSRGIIKCTLGRESTGFEDLISAYKIAPPDSSIKLRVATVAMRFYPNQPEHRDFVKKCVEVLINEINSKRYRSNPSLVLTMVTAIAERFLDERKVGELVKTLQAEIDWLDKLEGNTAWQYYFIRGWLAYELGELSTCWKYFELALEIINSDIPSGEDVSFSHSWMQDKEKFHQVLSRISVQLVDQHLLPTKELLKVYNFTNGQEITSRLDNQLLPDDIIEIVQNYSQSSNRPVSVFFSITAGDEIRICHLSSAAKETVEISTTSWNKNEIRRIREQTHLALKQANPVDLTVLDKKIQDWERVGSEIGSFIEPRLSTNCYVCFLPGRDLTGLPLHLIQMPDGTRLLEKTTVIFSPNFSTLLVSSKKTKTNNRQIAIITVTKQHDSEKFKARALDTSNDLSSLFSQTYQTFTLLENDAQHKDVINLLQQVEQIYFICHGANAGPSHGFGICIADEHQLPPSLMPITELPDLRRFILTWDDFEDIETCPELVVSIACSSGLTEVVAGGTRYGLEQTLLGKGTQALISPLWDIDQEAGLEWLKEFCKIKQENYDISYKDAYQKASMSIKGRFPHPFFWGSFILNGSLLSEDKL